MSWTEQDEVTGEKVSKVSPLLLIILVGVFGIGLATLLSCSDNMPRVPTAAAPKPPDPEDIFTSSSGDSGYWLIPDVTTDDDCCGDGGVEEEDDGSN